MDSPIYSTVLVIQSSGFLELCSFSQQIKHKKSQIMDKLCELHNNVQYFWVKIFHVSIYKLLQIFFGSF